LNESAEQTTSENAFNYRRALQNVKKALPNLRVIRFSGQHYYYPVNGVSFPDFRAQLIQFLDTTENE
jgi:hypothetical protein